jgi:cell division protein FtsB
VPAGGESILVARPTSRSSKPAPRGKRATKRRVRGRRSAVLLRWSVLAAAGFIAFLYYQPVSSYFETRSSLERRAAEVRQLREERSRLEARLADSTTVTALSREARRMSLVRPGERLFIVKGVQQWRRAQARQSGATIGRDG